MKSGALQEIRAAGGEVFAVTSEPQTLATEAAEEWETQFPVIGDPHHEIRKACKENDWLEVFYNENYGHLRNRPWASHPKGYYQPAVLAVHRSGRVLYRWRCVPKYSNMSGAGARPEADHTWEKIKAALDNAEDAPPDRNPLLGAKNVSWPWFLLILTAHGWFLRPKAFPLSRAGDRKRVRPAAVLKRIAGFVALWVVLLLVLPPGLVGLAALVWLAVLTPGLIEIHRQFQNEPDPY